MQGKGQKTGEANFKAGIFQEYFGTKKFAFQQEVDRIDFIITSNSGRHLIWAESKKNTAEILSILIQKFNHEPHKPSRTEENLPRRTRSFYGGNSIFFVQKLRVFSVSSVVFLFLDIPSSCG